MPGDLTLPNVTSHKKKQKYKLYCNFIGIKLQYSLYAMNVYDLPVYYHT